MTIRWTTLKNEPSTRRTATVGGTTVTATYYPPHGCYGYWLVQRGDEEWTVANWASVRDWANWAERMGQ